MGIDLQFQAFVNFLYNMNLLILMISGQRNNCGVKAVLHFALLIYAVTG